MVLVVRLRGGGEQVDRAAGVERDVVGNGGRGGGEGVVDGPWKVCVGYNRGGSAWWCRLVRPFAHSDNLTRALSPPGSTRQTT